MATRIEAVRNSSGQLHTVAAVVPTPAVKVKVTKRTDGPVTLLQKLQGYYKAGIAFVAAVLVILNEVTPITDFLPGTVKHYFDVIVAIVTAISTLLVKNQQWVDDL